MLSDYEGPSEFVLCLQTVYHSVILSIDTPTPRYTHTHTQKQKWAWLPPRNETLGLASWYYNYLIGLHTYL